MLEYWRKEPAVPSRHPGEIRALWHVSEITPVDRRNPKGSAWDVCEEHGVRTDGETKATKDGALDSQLPLHLTFRS
jgi:hypothetical protein